MDPPLPISGNLFIYARVPGLPAEAVQDVIDKVLEAVKIVAEIRRDQYGYDERRYYDADHYQYRDQYARYEWRSLPYFPLSFFARDIRLPALLDSVFLSIFHHNISPPLSLRQLNIGMRDFPIAFAKYAL
jgi:hypothetical protein